MLSTTRTRPVGPDARVRVAPFSDSRKRKVDIVGVAALVGAGRSATKGPPRLFRR
jgi:hypothetical protein